MTEQELRAEAFAWYPIRKSRDVGGLDDYLKMIEVDVKPRIASLVPIDTQDQALFGYSFGGLAALHALLTEPNAYRSFIVASPSIWWNNKSMLRDRAQFEAAITSGRAHPRILITMGGDESTPPKFVPPIWGITLAQIAEELRASRMVENAFELVCWLKSLHGDASYQIEDYAVLDQLFHGPSAWAALGRTVHWYMNRTCLRARGPASHIQQLNDRSAT